MRKIYMYVLHILAYVTCKSVQRLEFEKTRLQCETLRAGRGAKNFFLCTCLLFNMFRLSGVHSKKDLRLHFVYVRVGFLYY